MQDAKTGVLNGDVPLNLAADMGDFVMAAIMSIVGTSLITSLLCKAGCERLAKLD